MTLDCLAGQTITDVCSVGDKGVNIAFPSQNADIDLRASGWAFSVSVGLVTLSGIPATPTSGPFTTIAPSSDGTQAIWTLSGTEFSGSGAGPGVYVCQLTATNTNLGLELHSRCFIRVDAAW